MTVDGERVQHGFIAVAHVDADLGETERVAQRNGDDVNDGVQVEVGLQLVRQLEQRLKKLDLTALFLTILERQQHGTPTYRAAVPLPDGRRSVCQVYSAGAAGTRPRGSRPGGRVARAVNARGSGRGCSGRYTP